MFDKYHVKYTFEYKKLGNLNQDCFNELEIFALGANYHKNSDFKDPSVLTSETFNKSIPFIKKIIDQLNPFMQSSEFISCHLNKLLPMTYVEDHSDLIATSWPSIIHKIHIPIITNNQCGHMWASSKYKETNTVAHFEAGGIYLYNNVDLHSAVNLSNQERIHLIMRYSRGATDLK